MRKSTRATLSGIMIAIASLVALAMAYDEARDNLLRFLAGSVALLLIIMIIAISVVVVWTLLRKLFARLSATADESNQPPEE